MRSRSHRLILKRSPLAPYPLGVVTRRLGLHALSWVALLFSAIIIDYPANAAPAAQAPHPPVSPRRCQTDRECGAGAFCEHRTCRAVQRLLIPPYYRQRDAEREIDTIPPLFWRSHHRGWQTTTWIVGPFYRNTDPEGESRAFFPFYWHFSDARYGSSTSVLFPLAYRTQRADGSQFNVVLPFYFGKGKQHWSAGVFPLIFAGSAPNRSHIVVFPLFWRLKHGARSTTVLFPLFFAGHEPSRRHLVLFPLYGHFLSEQEHYDTHVVGTAFYSRSASGRVFGLAPLFAGGQRGSRQFATVPPLLFYLSRATHPASRNSSARDWTAVATLYYGHRKGTERVDYLFPLFYFKRSERPSQSILAVFPFIYYGRTPERLTVITPLTGVRRDRSRGLSQGFVGPFLWHRTARQSALALLPLFIHYRNAAARSETSVLLPLAVRHVSPSQTAHVLFPIVWRITDSKQRSLVLFPLFWQLRQRTGNDIDVLFPLYWRFRNQQRELRILGPAFASRRGDSYTAGILPLGFYRQGATGSTFASLPFFYYHDDITQQQRTLVIGPTYIRHYRRGYAAGLVPLLWRKQTPEREYTVLAPLIWHFAKPEEERSFTLFGPILYQRNKLERAWGLLPLLYRAHGGDTSTTALMPLFYYRSGLQQRALYTPLAGYYRSPDYAVWYAGTYLRWRSRWRALDLLFPLGLRHTNRQSQQTRIFALPSYYGSWNPGSSLHIAFPLFWRRSTVDTKDTVVFPVYWDFHDIHRQRTVAVLPLFVHSTDKAERSSWLLTPPAVWIRSRPNATDAVVFPLFWHFGGRHRSTTIAFPLYWDFKARVRRTTVVFPLYWRFDRQDSRTTVLANNYYWRSKRDGTFNYHFFPLFQIQRRRPGDLRVAFLMGLFGYERIGRERVLRLLFLPIRLTPPHQATQHASTQRRASILRQ